MPDKPKINLSRGTILDREKQSVAVVERQVKDYFLGRIWKEKTPDQALADLKTNYTEGSSKGKYLNQIDHYWQLYKEQYANKHLSSEQWPT